MATPHPLSLVPGKEQGVVSIPKRRGVALLSRAMPHSHGDSSVRVRGVARETMSRNSQQVK